VHRGAWNTEHHWGGDFTQWTGSLLQKKGLDELKRASGLLLAGPQGLRPARGRWGKRRGNRRLLVRAYDCLLRAETSCNFYWGSRWVHRSFVD